MRTSKSNIIKDMAKGFDINLADEICNLCIAKGFDPFVEFIHAQRLSALAYADWQGNAAYVTARMLVPPPKKSQNRWSLLPDNEDQFAMQSISYLSEHFFVCAEDFVLYRIIDHKHNIVRACSAMRERKIQEVGDVMRATLKADRKHASRQLLERMLDFFEHGEPARRTKPALLGQLGDDDYCLARMLTAPDASVAWPHIRQFVDRINDPEAFGAYVYSIVSGRYRGRQVLYLSSPEGQTGKSSFMRCLERVIGPAISTSYNGNMIKNSSHITSMFVGKKFVWIGDNKNANLLMTQQFKELSGDDRVSLDPKYEAPYSTYLECRVIVLSNYAPNISSESHNTSRTLWLTIAPFEGEPQGDFTLPYDAEFAGFLAWAKTCYEARCPDDTKIQVNDAVAQATDLRITQFEDPHRQVFENEFIVDGKGSVEAKRFNEVTERLRMNPYEIDDFKAWIERTYHPIVKKIVPGGWRYVGIRVKDARDHMDRNDALMDEVVG